MTALGKKPNSSLKLEKNKDRLSNLVQISQIADKCLNKGFSLKLKQMVEIEKSKENKIPPSIEPHKMYLHYPYFIPSGIFKTEVLLLRSN